jgi:poly-gamma-glutamate synthesis protein (capsule biosynthesis protein)
MKIALLGDIALYGKYSLTTSEKVYDYFSDISKMLKEYDHVIGNLETPFSINQKPYSYKSANIKSAPQNIDILKYLNIDIVNLANNHIYDYGKNSYNLTKELLNEYNIKYFGIEDTIINIEDNSSKIAIHGYCCYSTNPTGIAYKGGCGVNRLNVPYIKHKMNQLAIEGYLNILSMHCGQEHVNYPNYDHILLARQLSEVVPYVFYGHHPHVIQGIEIWKESFIAYSLGNFCFDDVYIEGCDLPLIKQYEANKKSFILDLEVINNKIVTYKIIPIYADKYFLSINHAHILKEIELYSSRLSEKKETYIAERSKKLLEYVGKRKKLRNINWYIKRLRFKYFMILLFAYINSIKYKKNVADALKK